MRGAIPLARAVTVHPRTCCCWGGWGGDHGAQNDKADVKATLAMPGWTRSNPRAEAFVELCGVELWRAGKRLTPGARGREGGAAKAGGRAPAAGDGVRDSAPPAPPPSVVIVPTAAPARRQPAAPGSMPEFAITCVKPPGGVPCRGTQCAARRRMSGAGDARAGPTMDLAALQVRAYIRMVSAWSLRLTRVLNGAAAGGGEADEDVSW